MLECPYCCAADHSQLITLAPQDGDASGSIEACRACGRYLKVFTVLQGCAPASVYVDNAGGASTMVAHLASCGHRTIAHSRRRVFAFFEGRRAAALPPWRSSIYRGNELMFDKRWLAGLAVVAVAGCDNSNPSIVADDASGSADLRTPSVARLWNDAT